MSRGPSFAPHGTDASTRPRGAVRRIAVGATIRHAPRAPLGAARRVAGGMAVVLAVLALAAALLLATALAVLRAEPGGWSVGVPIGVPRSITGDHLDLRRELRLSVPALVRVATHPLGIRLLAGRRVATRVGLVEFRATADGAGLLVRCAPCRLDAPSLAARPIVLGSAEASVQGADFGAWQGRLVLAGRGGAPVRATWSARLGSGSGGHDGEIAFTADDQPVRDWVSLFGDAVPEAARAEIAGTAGGTLRLSLPALEPTLVPRLAGLQVEGFGTEALVAARPALPACARVPRANRAGPPAPFGAWLPRAVVAAEDQRFFEHPGWDLAEMAAAWASDRPDRPSHLDRDREARRRGASTLTQQLAKLVLVGDEPTVARKLRELLAAAELERTLGKARILDLYLAIAPWGDGQCGAEAAALHLFGRPAARLDAVEAAWLASLLRNPDALLDRAARDASPDPRLVAIAAGLRVQPSAARAALLASARTFVPPPVVDVGRETPR